MARQDHQSIQAFKGKAFLPALTVYDYPTTRLLDEVGIPLLLVGDSLGMVVLGYPDTTHVSMADMLHHVQAASRAKPSGLLVADLPYRSYETPAQALENARLFRDAGADAVKLEGGEEVAKQIEAILGEGIACIGHLGMLPQRIAEEGTYRIKGRSDEERERLLRDASLLDNLGVTAMVLELVQPALATEITRRVLTPTIGIGSGTGCDGQILVTHDLIGAFPWFRPGFVSPKLDSASLIQGAVKGWRQEQSRIYQTFLAQDPSPDSA